MFKKNSVYRSLHCLKKYYLKNKKLNFTEKLLFISKLLIIIINNFVINNL